MNSVRCKSSKTLPIGITSGDPSGAGIDILRRLIQKDQIPSGKFRLMAPQSDFSDIDLEKFGIDLFNTAPANYCRTPGHPNEQSAKIALNGLEEVAYQCQKAQIQGVVTGPIYKFGMQKIGFVFPGQTEFFAERWGGVPTMAFAGGELKVVLATWHIPLRLVSKILNRSILDTALKRAIELGRKFGKDKPTIGVCGLNPHAGERGSIGTEEIEWINPFLDQFRKKYPLISPALPSDTIFWRQRRGEFDVVVALYHDQGLTPLKTLEMNRAVNLTLGLPWIRTSPDHGTAFDRAGKENLETGSFLRAIEICQQLCQHD